jgi:hypothetical protein
VRHPDRAGAISKSYELGETSEWFWGSDREAMWTKLRTSAQLERKASECTDGRQSGCGLVRGQ